MYDLIVSLTGDRNLDPYPFLSYHRWCISSSSCLRVCQIRTTIGSPDRRRCLSRLRINRPYSTSWGRWSLVWQTFWLSLLRIVTSRPSLSKDYTYLNKLKTCRSCVYMVTSTQLFHTMELKCNHEGRLKQSWIIIHWLSVHIQCAPHTESYAKILIHYACCLGDWAALNTLYLTNWVHCDYAVGVERFSVWIVALGVCQPKDTHAAWM